MSPETLQLIEALLADALPDTWVAVNRVGEVCVVVPKDRVGQYTLAIPHRPEGVA